MTVRQFRVFLTVGLMLGLFGAFADTVFPQLTPELIVQASDAQHAEEMKKLHGASLPASLGWLVLLIVFLLSFVSGAVGLYLLKPWAPRIALFSTVLGYLSMPILPYVTQSGLAYSANALSGTMWGAVLALAFLTPFNAHFKRPPT